ncbi:uncharacterized protein LOC104890399 [Beta vulgaris subsp. vulgaris]|uniref:uncharacterized protein LOC104890399 n=1 Tax=Beta vulgaris subsp. vulgaris TaxID=3555 RepID=UPI00254719DF|nr:uncharacterized protein LOC104890399 [Beta vulgaris subsp. vulgaris]
MLEKHYNKIIQADSKLYSISQQPFPYHASMYFNEIHFSNQLICFDNTPVALPPPIPSNNPSVMNFSGHSMSNSPSNISTSGNNPGYYDLSSINDEQPYYMNDQSQFSLMSSANLGTTHQQAGYVHSSSVHATMENNIGQYTLGYDNSTQQMTQLGNNSLPFMQDFLDHSSYGYQNQYYHDAGGNQYYQN